MNATLEMLLHRKVLAVIRDVSSDSIIPLVWALTDGGVGCVEVTLDSASEENTEDALQSISKLDKEFGDMITLGAGTVLSPNNVRRAAQAGARYIVSPDSNEEVIKETKSLGLVSVPGAMTPTEILRAWEWGADIIKLFPASVLGYDYIKAIKVPIRHIPLFAVGGVNQHNAREFLEAGCDGIGAGSYLINKKLIDAKDYFAIRTIAKEYAMACVGVYA